MIEAKRLIAYYDGDLRQAAREAGVGYQQLAAAACGETTRPAAKKIADHAAKLGISAHELDLTTLVQTFNMLDAMEETPDIFIAKSNIAVSIVRTGKAIGVFGRELQGGSD